MGGAACSATCIRLAGVLVDTNQWPQMLQLVAIPVGGRKRKTPPSLQVEHVRPVGGINVGQDHPAKHGLP